jgi:hypothetical protein
MQKNPHVLQNEVCVPWFEWGLKGREFTYQLTAMCKDGPASEQRIVSITHGVLHILKQ